MDPRAAGDIDAHHPDRLAAVERVVAALRADVAGRWTVSEMAEVAGWSPFHFSRVFKAVVGVSPGAFHAALRIERAKALLLTTDLPVTEVCFESGYDGLGTFTSRFGCFVGVSPGQLRRLPELTAGVLETVRRVPEPDGLEASAPGRIAGRVVGALPPGTLLFVGLFGAVIARGRPAAGTVLTECGPFRLGPVPDGCYRLLAVALPADGDPAAALLPGSTALVGAAPGSVEVRRGRASGRFDVVLRPLRPTDAPILIALPALLLPGSSDRR